jgi:hypothetical protein
MQPQYLNNLQNLKKMKEMLQLLIMNSLLASCGLHHFPTYNDAMPRHHRRGNEMHGH